jgi:hypothetical protein
LKPSNDFFPSYYFFYTTPLEHWICAPHAERGKAQQEKRMEEEKNFDSSCTRRRICAMSRDHTQRRKMSLNWVIRPTCPRGQ